MLVILPEHNLTRFLDSKSDFNPLIPCLKSCIFSGKHPNGFSTFKVDGINETRIWWLGAIKGPQSKPILARFDLTAKIYFNAGLVIKKSKPDSRHYDIIGFPVPAAPINRAKQMSQRQVMVNDAIVYMSDPIMLEKLKTHFQNGSQ